MLNYLLYQLGLFCRDEEQLSLLVEMFPESSKDYIVQTLRRYHGDMDMAIQALLECNSERFRDESVKYGGDEGSTNEGKEKSMALSNVGSDTHLKSFVLSRQADILSGNVSYNVGFKVRI